LLQIEQRLRESASVDPIGKTFKKFKTDDGPVFAEELEGNLVDAGVLKHGSDVTALRVPRRCAGEPRTTKTPPLLTGNALKELN
jgi:hypothetical protein